jgi:hypothetical protein
VNKHFDKAMLHWMEMCDSSLIIKGLRPFAMRHDLDIEASCQKGCDWGAIEIGGHYINPYDDVDSGDASAYLLRILQEDFGDIQIAVKDKDWCVACFWDVDGFDGPIIKGTTLIECLLGIAFCYRPKKGTRMNEIEPVLFGDEVVE